jgi:mRNA-degrading endonuclease YafQ of YafQ-DinJ toxin-antitoxin module
MRIEYHRLFLKHYQQRIAKDARLLRHYEARVTLFEAGERNAPLNDHALAGTKAGQRAFWVSGDIRVIYIELPDRYLFIDIGSHNQVYGG